MKWAAATALMIFLAASASPSLAAGPTTRPVRWDHESVVTVEADRETDHRWAWLDAGEARTFARQIATTQPGTADDQLAFAAHLLHRVGHGDAGAADLRELTDRVPARKNSERNIWVIQDALTPRRLQARVRLQGGERKKGLQWSLVATPAQRVTGIFSSECTLEGFEANRWGAYYPQAPETANQRHVSTELSLNVQSRERGSLIEESPLARTILFVRGNPIADAPRNRVQATVLLQASLCDTSLVHRPAGSPVPDEPASTAKERAARQHFLGSTDVITPDDPGIKRWIRENRYAPDLDETEIEFAQRVLRQIARDFEYDRGTETPAFEAPEVIRRRKAQCGGLSALYVTVPRSADIPARLLIGRNAQSAVPGRKFHSGGIDLQQHARAEFFARGIGWVPVEVTLSVTARSPAPNAATLPPDWLVGNVAGDFITTQFDTVVTFPCLLSGRIREQTLRDPQLAWAGSGSAKQISWSLGWTVMESAAQPTPAGTSGEAIPFQATGGH